MINSILNTIEILIHITLERKVEKKVVVIESSDKETKNRRKRKRKGTNNMDKINEIISKKSWIKAKRVVYPTTTLLALGKFKTEQKKKQKKKNPAVEVEIPKVDNKKRKRKNINNTDDVVKIKKNPE